jgi:hypothetical protein
LREIVQIAREILIGDGQFSGFVQTEERRVRLDCQLVERQVLGGFCDRSLEFGSPGIEALLRTCVDEIEGIAVENRPGYSDSIECLLRAMQPAKLLECRVVEGLYAE